LRKFGHCQRRFQLGMSLHYLWHLCYQQHKFDPKGMAEDIVSLKDSKTLLDM